MSEPKSLTQAEFARHRKVSKKTVTLWKQKGLLVLLDTGLVNVERTEWNLDQRPPTYRGGVTHRPVRSDPGNARATPSTPPRATKAKSDSSEPPRQHARPSEGAEEQGFDLDDENLPIILATQRKENALGLLRRQEFHTKSAKLVDRTAIEALFFAEFRDIRDAWLNWPARVAIVMAEELKLDPRVLTTVLAAHVRQHLAELGEPEPEIPEPRQR